VPKFMCLITEGNIFENKSYFKLLEIKYKLAHQKLGINFAQPFRDPLNWLNLRNIRIVNHMWMVICVNPCPNKLL